MDENPSKVTRSEAIYEDPSKARSRAAVERDRYYVYDRKVSGSTRLSAINPRFWIIDSTTGLPVDEFTTKPPADATARELNAAATPPAEVEPVENPAADQLQPLITGTSWSDPLTEPEPRHAPPEVIAEGEARLRREWDRIWDRVNSNPGSPVPRPILIQVLMLPDHFEKYQQWLAANNLMVGLMAEGGAPLTYVVTPIDNHPEATS